MIIKVCGMKFTENRMALEELPIHIFGFIFYPLSPRHVNPDDVQGLEYLVSTRKNKAGVFVDARVEDILEIVNKGKLTHVQLHGNETPETCRIIHAAGISVIKAFRIDDRFDFSDTEPYSEVADYFLFDTKAKKPGGTGLKFNWEKLSEYHLNIPFLLSGGIGPEDADAIKNFRHHMFYGIDLNSGFELAPGLKNKEKLEQFLQEIQNL